MLNAINYSLPAELDEAVRAMADRWRDQHKIRRVWEKDAAVWTGKDEAKWLGWLDIVDEEIRIVEQYRKFHDDIQNAGFDNILLMGMGGSSLCPEVLATTFDRKNFHILDSTVPAQIRAVEEKLDLAKTLFIVASKSGSTLEPNCFKQYFFEKLSEKVGAEKAGKQFVAITDPGSKMEQVGKVDGFRHIFYGKPEIGGRFSALSAFGMAPAAAMGLDVDKFLRNVADMVDTCRADDPAENPGALLGIILGVAHGQGRDKLTIFTSPRIYDLGAWLEQLLAESTGKDGKAIIPVDREPPQPPVSYGSDRVFVYLTLRGGAIDDEREQKIKAIAYAGLPFIEIEIEDVYDLGREFFRWEFATGVAGSIMEINPFNQPDVESAKVEARKLTDEYERVGKFPDESPFYEVDRIKLFSDEKYAIRLRGMVDELNLAELLSAHLANIEESDYFAILAYVQMDPVTQQLLQEIRQRVLGKRLASTCLGFGPRFLHSTGQAYKGGPNTGVFLQITADDEFDLPVPGQKYTFGVVKAAQARGDFQVLLDRGRRVLRVHLGSDVVSGLNKINSLI